MHEASHGRFPKLITLMPVFAQLLFDIEYHNIESVYTNTFKTQYSILVLMACTTRLSPFTDHVDIAVPTIELV